jgi:hypothetical protein
MSDTTARCCKSCAGAAIASQTQRAADDPDAFVDGWEVENVPPTSIAIRYINCLQLGR